MSLHDAGPAVDGGSASFAARVTAAQGGPLRARSIDTIQANIGLRCNLACVHCHVESSPTRREQMDVATMQRVLLIARVAGARTLDITGGAPELHPHLTWFIDAARSMQIGTIVRTNLTVLRIPERQHLPAWLASRNVHLIASLPCYLEDNVDRQRGNHVFEHSIAVLRTLNGLGYGIDPLLPLDLVFNPSGPSLPPPQAPLEAAYRARLDAQHGVRFRHLLALTNMPIGRFHADLVRQGEAGAYDHLLRGSFNPATVPGLMCTRQVHVRWDGVLSDCDFNAALEKPILGPRRTVHDVDLAQLLDRAIRTGPHCFGCTAGQGSSCGGALTP